MLSLLLALTTGVVVAVNNGLARTPQMGWNNWNSLGCDVSESLLLDTSLKLADSGLRDVGYNYVVLDDCWSDGRDEKGKIIVDRQRFPSGMKAIAKKLHDEGFLYGMYSSAGEMTCARYEGSLDYETQDADSWASWDVDYLKYGMLTPIHDLKPQADPFSQTIVIIGAGSGTRKSRSIGTT